MTTNSLQPDVKQRSLVPFVLFVLFIGVGLGYGINAFLAEQRQAAIAQRGAQVMPFDLEQTTHYFEPTNAGGIQQVTANDPNDQEQIQLVRAHLQEEVAKFTQGNFSDPAAIHGADMPGLATLRAGAERIQVQYTELPNGGQITYTTADPALVQALHQWFEAQLSDHGDHAEPGVHQ